MKVEIRRVFAVMSVLGILLISVVLSPPGICLAETDNVPDASQAQGIQAYAAYLSEHGGQTADAEIEVDISRGSADESLKPALTADEKGSILQLGGDSGAVQFEIDVQTEGGYAFYMEYKPGDSFEKINFSLLVDGRTPFQDALSINLERPYRLESEDFEQDSYGNDMTIDKLVAQEWLSKYLTDTTGNYEQPFRFYLPAGKHTIALDFKSANLSIRKMTFRGVKEPEPYRAPDSARNTSGQWIDLRAELPDRVSDSTLTALCDKADAATYPNNPGQNRLNVIGGSSWTQQGQWISYKFNIKTPGVYHIAFRARQNIRSGLFSTRRVYIDGQVPFTELGDVKFPNEIGWYNKVLGDDTPYGFHLDAGDHEIRLEVTPGIYADTMQAVAAATSALNEHYRRIIMITGVSPDAYQDYSLPENIPDLLGDFQSIRDILQREKERLETVSGLKGGETTTLTTIVTQLDSFVKDPRSIPDRLGAFRENISSLSAWYLQLSSQPLELDQIYVYSPDVELPKAKSGFFSNLVFNIRAIIASFVSDYGTIDYMQGNKTNELKVWINTGRDQLKVLNQIVTDDFQAKYKTKVTLNISAASGAEQPIQQGLIEMLLAGKAPDISLLAPSSNPIDLSLRKALIPLNQFVDFGEVAGRFNEQALVPYRLGNNTYALPVTQSFNMMFYRKDILAELGVEPPKTWDDLYRIIPIIQSNNLAVGIPAEVSTFQTMLYQRGVNVYKDDLRKTNFDTPEALDAFVKWTDLYSTYSFPLTYDFFSRFRTGEMPIGIAGFTMYTQLTVSAPEITGLWDMTLVPGTAGEDGTVNHAVTGVGSLCTFITKNTKNKDLAWEFLKWFTSTDTQYEYGVQQEMVLGPTARYASANLEAFAKLPWGREVRAVLDEQRRYIKEVPQIPGGYYVTRDIENALKQVVLNSENPRQILNYYNLNINGEIRRKRIELGLDKD